MSPSSMGQNNQKIITCFLYNIQNLKIKLAKKNETKAEICNIIEYFHEKDRQTYWILLIERFEYHSNIRF